MRYGLSLCGLAVLVLIGCSKSEPKAPVAALSGGPAAQASPAPALLETHAGTVEDPKVVVSAFLDALRTGSDEAAMKLLTAEARRKAIEANRSPAPPASETARFALGQVSYVGEDGAQVECTWSDLDEAGKLHSDHATWVCRKEVEGWRVAGVAAVVFEGEPPLLLNFEDPQEMQKKQAWLRDEIARRAKQQDSPAAEKPAAEAQNKPQDAFRR
jgi:hypothetical protein